MDLMSFIRDHFAHAGPILACAAFGLIIAIERFIAFNDIYAMKERGQFFEKLKVYVMADRLRDAIALCNLHERKPLAHVVRQGLMRAHQPEEMIQDGMAMAVIQAQRTIQKRTAYLAMIANVATLLGLFGTIAGLISSFEAIGKADPSKKSELLAAGISTSMNATMMGLGVAIPCMVIYSFLMNKQNRLVSELNESAIETMDILRQRFYNQAPPAGGQPGHGQRRSA